MPVAIKDRQSLVLKLEGEEIEVYFRRPNAPEMVRYLAASLSGQGPQSMAQMLEAGLELGVSCILGVREGDIVLAEGDGLRALVTDPAQPGFEKNWKELLKDKLPGLLLMLGNHLVKMTRSELEVREKN